MLLFLLEWMFAYVILNLFYDSANYLAILPLVYVEPNVIQLYVMEYKNLLF